MNSFVRFILMLLVVGIGISLAFVLAANARSQQATTQALASDRQTFRDLVTEVSGRLRRADLIVEKQLMDHQNQALETTLLVRQYASAGTDQSHPLPIERVIIPGNQVHIDGLMLTFDSMFGADDSDLGVLAGTTLLLFARVYGVAPEEEDSAPETRFTFLPEGKSPQLTRIRPLDAGATMYEAKIWRNIWRLIGTPPADASSGGISGSRGGMRFRWLRPASRTVVTGHCYSAFLSYDGTLTIDEDPQVNIPGLVGLMITQAREQDEVLLRRAGGSPRPER